MIPQLYGHLIATLVTKFLTIVNPLAAVTEKNRFNRKNTVMDDNNIEFWTRLIDVEFFECFLKRNQIHIKFSH